MALETPQRFEDRLLDELLALQQTELRPVRTTSAARRRSRRTLIAACAAPILVIGGVALLLSSLLGASHPGLAKAAVLKHAAAALQPDGKILYVEATVYESGGFCLGKEVPSRCILAPTNDASLSREPSEDPVAYTYREWVGPSANEDHVVYETGDETSTHGETREVYDPGDNTITTSKEAVGSALEASLTTGIPAVQDLTLADLKALYAIAQSSSPAIRFLGKTIIDGEAAYELEMTRSEHLLAPTPSKTTLLLYISARSFLPLRAVTSGTQPDSSTNATRGIVTFSARTLPNTASNEALLRLDRHAGAATVTFSQAKQSHVRPVFVRP